MSRPAILVVNDGEQVARVLEKVLRRDATVRAAGSGTAAIRSLEKRAFSVVVCDLNLRGLGGLDVLRSCKSLQPDAQFVLMATRASVPTAIEAMREGAYDYIVKPVEPDHLRAVVLRAIGRSAVSSSAGLHSGSERNEVLPGIFARSEVMRQLAARVQRVAASDAAVLVIGEIGTGKDRIARAIHSVSARGRERMVAVNCAVIPAELLESDLFGYALGAFTGAAHDRAGLFEQADAGTLYLDEISDIRPSLQARLTRAIDERATCRLGESTERGANARLIVSTHRDLEAMVHAGTFRKDLWYRLNVAVVRVPALRERPEDIELLTLHFLRELAPIAPSRRSQELTQAAVGALTRYDWPGNVRELRAAIERASISAGGAAVDVEHLPREVTGTWPQPLSEKLMSLGWQEAMDLQCPQTGHQYLQALLDRYRGQIVEAATHAGIGRTSFYRLMRKYGIHTDGGAGVENQ